MDVVTRYGHRKEKTKAYANQKIWPDPESPGTWKCRVFRDIHGPPECLFCIPSPILAFRDIEQKSRVDLSYQFEYCYSLKL
jgi:hypothetical protein